MNKNIITIGAIVGRNRIISIQNEYHFIIEVANLIG